MIAVLIAGGSGTRLWPISTPAYPKHLLKVNGDDLSLLQRSYERAKTIADEVYVVTEKSHSHYVREQLPNLDDDHCIVEPARRSTSGCVLAALVRIAKRHDENEPVSILWADHFIRDIDGFVHSFAAAEKATKQYDRVVLVGIEPAYAATGFGYIKKGKQVSSDPYLFEVSEFKEKPQFDVARKYYISGNYLWNGGYLVGSLRTFLDTMQTYAPEMFSQYQLLKCASDEADFNAKYLTRESVAIDYSFSEKVKNLLVVPAAFDWQDLGSFQDMYTAVDRDENGNHLSGNNLEVLDVENAYIQNEGDTPLIVIGLDNIVIVNTPQGILVARKDLSQQVGDISKRLTS